MTKKTSFFILLLFSVAVLIGLCFWWFRSIPSRAIHLRNVSFSDLPGWQSADARLSFHAFQKSCRAFLKQNPDKNVGNERIKLKVRDWQLICNAAVDFHPTSSEKAREFFEHWFEPVTFYDDHQVEGLFTGYYMPVLNGSLTKTEQYKIPIYGLPDDLISVDLSEFDPALKAHKKILGRVQGKRLVPYYTHEEITGGKIADKAPVIAWIEHHVDRQFLEIQGSGIIALPNGKKLFVGYAGQNGAPYRSIAGVLIEKGVMTKHNSSMQRIRQYLQAHPEQIKPVLHQNKSFVFFGKLPQEEALGAQGVGLTPGYSLAVDRTWVPMGVPVWLTTTRPNEESDHGSRLNRLMIAQDTGGAIRGPVRGDVFWGGDAEAGQVAGKMKNKGYYWLLLPRTSSN